VDKVSVTGSTSIGTTASTTTLVRHSGTSTTSTYGAALSFDVTVGGSSGTPTGTVTLKDGGSCGTTLGSASLTGGTCTINTTTLVAGSHANIVAVYIGDGTYVTSTSSALSTQTVNKATPSVTVTGATGFFFNGSSQGPNTATTGGSTGALEFSYVGTGGTPYPASSTPPAIIGSYTCTATVAADATGGKTITIQEPATDAWVQRTPGATEKPVTGQFFARDGTTGKARSITTAPRPRPPRRF